MDSNRFDEFTRALATARSRRQAAKLIAATTVGGLLGLSGADSALARLSEAGSTRSRMSGADSAPARLSEAGSTRSRMSGADSAPAVKADSALSMTAPCKSNGSRCAFDTSCCSRNCQGFKCQKCRPNGTYCVHNDECCSKSCLFYKCRRF